MENQLLQVKTQVAIAIADQHLLDRKLKEHQDAVQQWHRKAELAVEKKNDDLARAALERSLSHQQLADGFAQQLDDQTTEAETLRTAFTKLQQKLQETQSTTELLLARSRRARTIGKANSARNLTATHNTTSVLNRLRQALKGAKRLTLQVICCRLNRLKIALRRLKRRTRLIGCLKI